MLTTLFSGNVQKNQRKLKKMQKTKGGNVAGITHDRSLLRRLVTNHGSQIGAEQDGTPQIASGTKMI